ncbi:MAG: DUF4442 domain-containing protein [Saprospiraceae bacterium]|nr:DUF4442 domain-containing protein [Saprospiraceae bacterium]MDW8229882.1 DUF4442 domain-containing protein [Saprospiraceae bacterium]
MTRWLNSRWRFRFFLWWKLPAAAFMGIRLEQIDAGRCVVQLPYGWRSQNPFHSIYFAAQCAAAELSTGLPAWMAVQGQEAPVSMLITHLEANFLKKAAQMVRFTCESVEDIAGAVQRAAHTGEAQTLRVLSIGRLPDGTEVAHIWVTWAFRRKKP